MTVRSVLRAAWWRRRPWLPVVTALVFIVALAARLIPVLRGAGLFGLDSHDDGVYYAAALALVHGQLPYRHFLFLHPPGVILALSPFAALGTATSEGLGFAAGRVAWMVMGATTAGLIVLGLRRAGWLAALVGGLGYAFYLPAIRTERTTMLEGLTSLLLASTLLVLGATRLRRRHPWWVFVGAGALLGIVAGTKIWNVVAVAIAVVWVAVAFGAGRALRLALGSVLGVTVVCLPFFLAAPAAMWRMVVVDQVGRPDVTADVITRLGAIAGLPELPLPDPRVVLPAVIALAALVMIALTQRERLAPLLTLGFAAVVLLTPSFYFHYPAALAVPLALTLGSAVAVLQGWATAAGSWARRSVVVASVLALVVLALPVTDLRSGIRLPVDTLSAAVIAAPGCVTSDDAVVLIEFGVFGRNIDRGCQTVVDLTGYSYDLTRGVDVPRMRNPVFQQFALDYLSGGDVSMPWRLRQGWGYSGRTAREIASWPQLARSGTYVVREPKAELGRGR